MRPTREMRPRPILSLGLGGTLGTGGSAVDDHIDDATDAHDASAVSVLDSAGLFAGVNVETVLLEIARRVFGYLPHGDISGTEGFDAAYSWHSAILVGDCDITLTGVPTGTVSDMVLELAQDGTGGWTIDLPSSVVNGAALEATQVTTASTTQLLLLLSRDGGTNWYGFWGGGSGAAVGALDDLSDVTITAAAENDTLRYNGSAWVDDNRRWEPVTFNFGSGPELVWDGDDLVMEWKAY